MSTSDQPLLKRWAKDFEAVARSIPEEWIDYHDGAAFIKPGHEDDPQVHLYLELTRVGYAKGWL